MRPDDCRRLSPQAQEAVRIRVVRAMSHGMTRTQAAEVFGVSRTSIWNWEQRLHSNQPQPLRSKRPGRKPRMLRLLQPEQEAAICALIADNYPDELNLPFYLWSTDAVRSLVNKRYHLSISTRTIRRYLGRWGMSPQQAVRRALERNAQLIGQWLIDVYPQIRQVAHEEKALILWGDETGIRSDRISARAWSMRGHPPELRGTGKRLCLNMISAISNMGKLYFSLFSGRFTARIFIGFLRQLLRQVDQPIFFITDAHPVHNSAQVDRWLSEHENRLLLFELPPYCPELNPDELLNSDVKRIALSQQPIEHVKQMERAVRKHLKKRQRQPRIVANLFSQKDVRYASQDFTA